MISFTNTIGATQIQLENYEMEDSETSLTINKT